MNRFFKARSVGLVSQVVSDVSSGCYICMSSRFGIKNWSFFPRETVALSTSRESRMDTVWLMQLDCWCLLCRCLRGIASAAEMLSRRLSQAYVKLPRGKSSKSQMSQISVVAKLLPRAAAAISRHSFGISRVQQVAHQAAPCQKKDRPSPLAQPGW